MFITADADMANDLAKTNPEAAALLLILSEYSRDLSVPIRMQGDSFSSILADDETLERIKSGDHTKPQNAKSVSSLNAHVAQLKWEFKKLPGENRLKLSHRLLNDKNEEIRAIYPDVVVTLVWESTGSTGYWRAKSWSVD